MVDGVHRRRPRRAAPARCRCSRSPSRAGCAARGSAGRAGRPAGPRRRPTRRPAARAGAARARRATAMKPACGPPKNSGTPKRWLEPTHDVGAQLARRLEQGQREQVGGHDGQRAALRAPRSITRSRVARPGRWRRGTGPARPQSRPSGRPSSRSATTTSMPIARARVSHDGDRLREAVLVDDEAPSRRSRGWPAGPASSPRRPPSPRRAATRSPSAARSRSLTTVWKFSSASSRPWRDLRLVRRVRGVPGRVLEHVAPDHRGRDRAGVAEPDHRASGVVAGGECAQLGERLDLARAAAAGPSGCAGIGCGGTAAAISSSSVA